MKKISLMAAVSMVAVASSANADANFGGASLGVNLGYGFVNAELKDTTGATTSNTELGLKGANGGLHVGYGKMFSEYYLGLEASADLNGEKNTTSTTNATATVKNELKKKNSIGVALKAGRTFGSTLGYVKLGYASSKFETTYAIGAVEGKGSKRLNAFVPGFGMATMVAKNVELGAEYNHYFYQTLKVSTNDDTANTVQPRGGEAKIRLTYKF